MKLNHSKIKAGAELLLALGGALTAFAAVLVAIEKVQTKKEEPPALTE